MDSTSRDAAVDLTTLPFLTVRRVCVLADCSPVTVKRSPLVPAGRRGRVLVYKTSDVIAWIRGRLGDDGVPNDEIVPPVPPVPPSTRGTLRSTALERIAATARGER